MNRPELSGAVWRKSSHSGANEGECVEVAAVWRKSSHSGGNEGNCVEIAGIWRKSGRSGGNEGSCVEISSDWMKSSHSGGDEGACVEVAGQAGRVVAARDSKDPDGPVLCFEQGAWGAFADAVKSGAYDGR